MPENINDVSPEIVAEHERWLDEERRHWLAQPFGSELEEILCCKLANRCGPDVTAENQVWFDCRPAGTFRVDLLLTHNSRRGIFRYVVECDGRRFHDPEKDARRDAALKASGVSRVIHVPAWKVWANCDAAADEVMGQLIDLFPRFREYDGYEADWEYYAAENRGEDMGIWSEHNRPESYL